MPDRINDLWPCPSRSLTRAILQSLDEDTFSELRRRIRRRARRNSGSDRHAKSLVREIEKRRYSESTRVRHQRLFKAEFHESEILEALCPRRRRQWVAPRARSAQQRLRFQDFSFIDNPVGALTDLARLAQIETYCREVRVDFADVYMKDISPYLVWGMIREAMAPILVGGKINYPVRAAVEATGLAQFMRIAPMGPSLGHAIVPFPLRRRRPAYSSEDRDIAFNPSTREKLADDLVTTISTCVRRAGLELNHDGAHGVCSLVGEVLDNAERHSRDGGDGDWAVAGFVVSRQDSGSSGRLLHYCNFAFVNVGRTIAETITTASDAHVAGSLSTYSGAHGGENADRRALLATVLALQDGMSCVSQTRGSSGGVGMMSALEAVYGLGSELARSQDQALVIVSGNSCVRFLPPFWSPVVQNGLRYQWFNEEQSPNKPPANTHAFNLPHRFPGTIISARFVLAEAATTSRGGVG
jgi:hypothetical protein